MVKYFRRKWNFFYGHILLPVILEGHFSANLLGCLSLAENRVVRLTDRHKMTYSKNTKIHILIIHTKQEKYQSGVRFFSEQLRVFRGAGPPDCPNGAFVYRKILNTYYDIYLFVSLIFFIYACAYLQFCRHAHAYVFLFCFVIPSSILPIPCYFFLLLRVLTYLAIIVTIFTFFSKHTHVRIWLFPDSRLWIALSESVKITTFSGLFSNIHWSAFRIAINSDV